MLLRSVLRVFHARPLDAGHTPYDAAMADWFDAARLGIFVHWGPYSAARLEPSWPMVGGVGALPGAADLTVADYDRLTAGWVPPPGAPRRWAELAEACGASYAVLTTKHHDGFTLFPSAHSAHGIHATAPGRDLVGEYVEAMRERSIRVGFYFSLPDWHHPSYPAFTDAMRPYSALSYPRPAPEAWARFLEDQRGQLDELLTRYGRIDLLWWDGGWERTAGEWDSAGLESFVRERQPGIVMNDRCPGIGGYGSMLHEGVIPLDPPAGPWEACMTMDESWGPLEDGGRRKSAAELVWLVAEAAAAEGRLLLNVAPLGDGALPAWQEERLIELAAWMAGHGEAVHGTTGAGLRAGQHYGPATRRGDRYYLVCTLAPRHTLVLREVRGRRITSARVLGAKGRPVALDLRISAVERLLYGADPLCDVLVEVPPDALDPLATVIELTVSGDLL